MFVYITIFAICRGIQFRCGGTLISKRYVLTAAHCVTNLPKISLAGVRLGEYDINSAEDCQVDACAPPPQNFGIEEAVYHPSFTKDKLHNDVAIIRMDGDADLTTSVQPICLPVGPKLQSLSLDGERVTVAGWGATELGTASPILLKVELPVVSVPECMDIYRKTVTVTIKQICAGGSGGTDSCEGDSGGPLKTQTEIAPGDYRFVQYGIVSFGPRRCGTVGKPGVYTRVGYYMQWILDTMKP